LHIAHPGFFLFPVRKSVPRPEEVQKSGLGNEISRPAPTPQSWKHPGNLAKSRKCPGNLMEAWKLWQKICTNQGTNVEQISENLLA
jgi:hypothetical protein